MMAVSAEFLEYVLGQLPTPWNITARRMFGAVGLYGDGVFFGLISDDVLYFKVGDTNRRDYEARGMSQFRPYRDRPQVSMSYYEVPADVLEDAEECVIWARRSLIVATVRKKGRSGKSPETTRRARRGTHR